jgi:hypothetical protein
MRPWQYWWARMTWIMQYDPPRFVESLMLGLAVVLLLAWYLVDTRAGSNNSWAYLVLSLSYAAGSALSILVRETWISVTRDRATQVTALVLLLTSTYVFACVFQDSYRYL